MKKVLVAVMAAGIAGWSFADVAEEACDDQNLRITAGGFARGSMKAKIQNSTDRAEMYGADLDVYYRVMEKDSFSLWAGIGGTFSPYQDVAKMSFNEVDASDPFVTIELGGKAEAEVEYGELRLMLVPEYAVNESWSIGARMGVAFDWLKARGSLSTWSRTTIAIPGIPSTVIPVGPSKDSAEFSDFVAQGVVGLQTSYMFADNFGIYASIEYRAGSEAEFKKGGEKFGALDMDGWFAGAGIVIQF
ncbi:MAG: hypothetical protein J6S30_04685 [Kiritimatiellae bacterium]|nr:hypothetical protein [Kiritimatiellia bacterium]